MFKVKKIHIVYLGLRGARESEEGGHIQLYIFSYSSTNFHLALGSIFFLEFFC